MKAPEGSPWAEVTSLLQKEAKGPGAEKGRARASILEVADWLTKNNVPVAAPAAEDDGILERLSGDSEHYRNAAGGWTKNGESLMTWAKEMLRRARALHEAKEQEMAKQKTEEAPEEEDFEGDEEEGEEDEGGEEEAEAAPEEDEPAPRRKPIRRQQAQQPIIVQMGPSQRSARAKQPQAQPTLRGLIPRTEKVRLFKRDERGKRVLIDDYTVEDLAGTKLADFIEEVVHPRFANEAMPTEYIAFEVDARTDNVKGPPFKHVMEPDESEAQDGRGADPFTTVHRAMGLIRELQGDKPEPEKNPALAAMQQRAASSGDMNGVLMMMMMEKLFAQSQRGASSPDTELVMKLVDRLDRLEGKKTDNQMGPPPWMMAPPPPPPPQPPMTSAMDKVMELAVAKLAAPPPSTFEMAKELASVQQLLTGNKSGSNDELNSLRNEMSQLRSAMMTKPKGGLEESLETFEKVTTMVKSVAPQVNGEAAGGFAGFLKGLLTPEVAKTIAGVVGGAAGQGAQPVQQGAQPQQATAQPAQAAQAAQPQPPPRDINRPPNPVPPAVVDAAKQMRLAQTPPVRAEKFADFILAMYTSGDPYYTQVLLKKPIESLMVAPITVETLKPARQLAMLLLAEQNPEWATPDFVDVCIATLGMKVGIEVPAALRDSAGAWTLDFRGNVIMLDTVAKPVRTEPARVEAPAAPATPAAEPVETATADLSPIATGNFPKAEPLSVVEQAAPKANVRDVRAPIPLTVVAPAPQA